MFVPPPTQLEKYLSFITCHFPPKCLSFACLLAVSFPAYSSLYPEIIIDNLGKFIDENSISYDNGAIAVKDSTSYLINGNQLIENGKWYYGVYSNKSIEISGLSDSDQNAVISSQGSGDKESALLKIRLRKTGDIGLSNLAFDGKNHNGKAIVFEKYSSENAIQSNLIMKEIDIFNFGNDKDDSSESALVGGTPNNWSSGKEPMWFLTASLTDIDFEDNVTNGANANLLNLKAQELSYQDGKVNNNIVNQTSLLSLDVGTAKISKLTVLENEFYGFALDVKYWDDISSGADQDGTVSIGHSIFQNNKSLSKNSGGSLSITGYKNVFLDSIYFKGNSSNAEQVYLSGNSEVSLHNVNFNENTSRFGMIHAVQAHSQSNQSFTLNLENISAINNSSASPQYGTVLTLQGEIESTIFNADITLKNDRQINWINKTSDGSERFSMVFNFQNSSSSVNLNFETNADFSSNLGISSYKGEPWGNNGQLNIIKTGNRTFTLGGISKFDVDTSWEIQQGEFSLMDDAKLQWRELSETSYFKVNSGATFSAGLYDVTEIKPGSHGSYAPISLAGNSFLMQQDSTLNIKVLNPNKALDSSSGQGWLIVAENANLDETSSPLIHIGDANNWIYQFEGDGLGLQQGIPSNGNVVEGTEDNIYLGYRLKHEINPDESAKGITNVTSHFALSTAVKMFESTLYWRPQMSDSLWVKPIYIHDRREPGSTTGFDANIRGVGVGKDFKTENGYWGIALGRNDGSIHSLGSTAYTSGDLQSTWGAIYTDQHKNNWSFSGVIGYLYQKADQNQLNDAAELHTNTRNDVLLAEGNISYSHNIYRQDDGWMTLSPSIGLQYVYLAQKDFNLTLSDGTHLLKGKQESMNIFSIPFNLKWQYDMLGKESTRHNLFVSVGGLINLSKRDMNNDYIDMYGNKAGQWSLIPLDRWQSNIRAGYTLYDLEENMTLSIETGYNHSTHRELTDINAVVRWVW